MKTYRFSIVIEKDEEGYFTFCPELQGCYTQGDTYEEVLEIAWIAERKFLKHSLLALLLWKWLYNNGEATANNRCRSD